MECYRVKFHVSGPEEIGRENVRMALFFLPGHKPFFITCILLMVHQAR